MTSNAFFTEFPELPDEHVEASATQLLSDYSEFSGSSVGTPIPVEAIAGLFQEYQCPIGEYGCLRW
mgnify:CR=1 FL=1